VAVANAEDKAVLWGFIRRRAPGASPQTQPRLDALVGYAVRYFKDFVKPAKQYRLADDVERAALESLSKALGDLPADASAEDIQTLLYDVARPIPRYQNPNAKGATLERPGVSNAWFNTLYELLLGDAQGPRFGSFVSIYGIPETRELIAKALSGALIGEHDAFLAERERGAALCARRLYSVAHTTLALQAISCGCSTQSGRFGPQPVRFSPPCSVPARRRTSSTPL
jgi:lysyl-tRNA synthetase class 1